MIPDTRPLAQLLRQRITGEVRFDSSSLAMYATDSSNYRQVPVGVVVPRTIDDVVATITTCREFDIPILNRGAGTSLAGQTCNAAIILDFSKYLNNVLELSPELRWARVQPGTILDDLCNRAQLHELTFGPDPATRDRCTLGGMLGNNSCGVHSIMSGRMSDNVEELEILTSDGVRMRVGPTTEEELEQIIAEGGRRGEIYAGLKRIRDRYGDLIRTRFPKLPRRVSGFNLDELLPENGFNVARALVGTEGTCVTILEAKLRLVPNPRSRSLLVLGYKDVFTSADESPRIMESKPIGLEGLDEYLRSFQLAKPNLTPEEASLLPEGHGWLLVEFGGDTREEADTKAQELISRLSRAPSVPSVKFTTPREARMVWDLRKSGLGATAFLPGGRNAWPGWEDAAVPPHKLGAYLREFTVLRDSYRYESAMYGHFGDGCVHMRLNFDLFSREGVKKFVSFIDAAGDLVASHGGSMSGEHGDGQARAHLLPKMFGDELVEAFHEFKQIWDPKRLMNPGKVVDSRGPDENLRLGSEYRPWRPETTFRFPESDGSFARAMLRCIGVGKCRRLEGGGMCPSFMVTREETHSTRGRARLMQEMLRGEIIRDGWRSEEVKESLELCLSCKACKTDCPTRVDLATYKAEFLSHYYRGHWRGMSAYVIGLIPWWARLASIAPGIANFFSQTEPFAGIMKRVTGIARERRLPRFAPQTFRTWFGKRRSVETGEGRRVILWADTFNNHFSPDVARAATEVLESAGWRVELPRRHLCCGRPLYDHGFIDLAKRLLREILHELHQEIEAGTPVIVLEPSCAAVFRDELTALFPDDASALKLSRQTFLFAEFLQKYAPDLTVACLEQDALFHGHCHQRAIAGTRSDEILLERMGVKVETPENGCCGMAGGFGFRAATFPVSVQIADRALTPALKEATNDTLVVADGFSCREQIRHVSGREALHLAQVIRMALQLHEKDRPPTG